MFSFLKKKVKATEVALALLEFTCRSRDSTQDDELLSDSEIEINQEHVEMEKVYLRAFAVDFAVQNMVRNGLLTEKLGNSILYEYYYHWKQMSEETSNQTPNDVNLYDCLEDRLLVYTEALKEPTHREQDRFWNIGRAFSKLCVGRTSLVLNTLGMTEFGAHLVSVGKLISKFKKRFRVVE